MKFNELSDMMQKPEPKPDTYEAGMALNQLLKIGSHAIKIHNMIDDSQEMESWVAKKIDLASNYVKSVHGYTAGSKVGTYDDGGMTESREQIGDYAREIKSGRIVRIVDFTPDEDGDIYTISYGEDQGENDVFAKDLKFLDQTGSDQEEIGKFDEDAGSLTDEQKKGLDMINKKYGNRVGGNGDSLPQGYMLMRLKTGVGTDGIDDQEMSATLKKYGHDSMYDAEQADDDFYEKIYNKEHLPITIAMVNDLAKVMGTDFDNDQKLSDAYDYLYNRDESVSEDAGEGHMSKSQLYQTAKMAIELLDMIKKGDDLEGWVQTKLNLAADYLQAVYHYEDYQKLNPYREELDSSLIQRHAGIIQKHLDEILERKCRTEDVDTKPGMMRILKKRVNEVEKEIAKENRKQTDEAALEEGKIKDWAKSLAMAGVFVAGLAGVGSIQDAINNNVPAIQAMNTALEMAKERGDDNLVAQIEKDLKGAKLRLDIGKDLNQVKYLQDKYEKFIQTESLTYESKLQINLNQRLK